MSSHLREAFDKNGYLLFPSRLRVEEVENLCAKIQERLRVCAQDLCCSYQEYLSTVSRWVAPSPITEGLEKFSLTYLQEILRDFIDGPELVKLNVISKTPMSPDPTPFHQDISYSPEAPYELSAWLALTDVPLASGPVAILEASHTGAIEPAVDFWCPTFVQKDFSKDMNYKPLPVKQGQIILFDSRLWHGSEKNQGIHHRFAMVTRWRGKNYIPPKIPPIQPQPFGMWTCQKKTEEILKTALPFPLKGKIDGYVNLLNYWINYIKATPPTFLKSSQKSIESLEQVRLLHLAHKNHNGGDSQGTAYAKLWQTFLFPLSNTLKNEAGP
jgi:hypothetical protein